MSSELSDGEQGGPTSTIHAFIYFALFATNFLDTHLELSSPASTS